MGVQVPSPAPLEYKMNCLGSSFFFDINKVDNTNNEYQNIQELSITLKDVDNKIDERPIYYDVLKDLYTYGVIKGNDID